MADEKEVKLAADKRSRAARGSLPIRPEGAAGTGGNYIKHHRGDRDFIIPKGLLGYSGHSPAFSAKEVAELWCLAILRASEKDREGYYWYGRSLVNEIRERTTIVGVADGVHVSDGVIFGLIKSWLDATPPLVEIADVARAKGPNPATMIRITEAGIAHHEQLKAEHQRNILRGQMALNRLHVDVYGYSTLSVPDFKTQYLDQNLEPLELGRPKGEE